MVGKQKQFVVFLIDSDEYGADINKVTIIERMLNVTRDRKSVV